MKLSWVDYFPLIFVALVDVVILALVFLALSPKEILASASSSIHSASFRLTFTYPFSIQPMVRHRARAGKSEFHHRCKPA
jgi:hypothetical protein